MTRLYILLLFLIGSRLVFGQSKFCIKIDSNFCYIKEKFLSSTIVIDKKIESKEDVEATEHILLADMDGDCIPELIITASNYEKILIIDSKTGLTKWEINTPNLDRFRHSIAIADLNDDGIPEIFHKDNNGKLRCYNPDGSILWISDQTVESDIRNQKGGNIAFADFNQDGIPELYINNKIFNAKTGIKLADGGVNGIGGGWDINGYTFLPLTIAAQLDNDTTDLELAAGYTVYKVIIRNTNGLVGNSMIANNIKINNEFRDGYTAVADINSDGKLDIVVEAMALSNNVLLYAYTLSNGIPQLLAKVSFNAGIEATFAPPCIGDIKGNGKASILFSRTSILNSYSYDGTSTFQLDWSTNTNDQGSPAILTMFDFNFDGIQEIVFRDDTFLRIFNGSVIPPIEISKSLCYSNTYLEQLVIGDIDHSGLAKICVPCGSLSNVAIGKLTVFGSPDSLPGWAPARGIWNQYNYHVLNINDDLTVPRVQKNNATYKNGKYNNFFVQESLLDSNGMYLKRAASLTGKIKCINYDPKNDEYTVIFDIYNRTDASFNADSSLPVSFYNGDPATGGILIGTYYTLKKLFSGDSLLNLEFKFTVANLTDLFMVINTKRNASGQFDPSDFSIAECDYTDNIFRTLKLPRIEKLNASICKGDTYNFYDSLINDAGIYYHKLSSVNGCDSLIFNLELTTVDTIHIRQAINACDSYSWNGQTLTQSGTFIYDTLNQFGCDSITTLDLVLNKSDHINIQHTACDSFIWNGTTYDKSGSYPYQTVNSSGCDSISTLELVINNSDDQVINHTACISYTWNGQIYTQSGTYKFDTVNRFGCDSTISLNLTINSVINVNLVDATCDTYTWNGNTYTQSGTYQYKTINQQGCDSITTLQLTINKSNNSTTSLTTCDSYSWNGVTYSQSGTYLHKTLNTAGCDSTVTLQLTISKSTNSITNSTSCDRYVWNGNTYTQSGIYQFQTLNATGCDSLASLNLIINQSDTLDLNQTACDTFSWNGNTYDKSGYYPYQSINSLGCDSVINLNLTINKSTKADLALSVCDSINFLGTILKTNGIYPFKIQNSEGCDSVINLSLNIRSENYSNAVNRCDSFTWNLTSLSYNQSGVYIQKYVNSYGCDSTYLLDLTINKSYEELQLAQACKEYVWKVNNNLLNQSGEYRYPLKSNAGCDSILILNLSIYQDFEKTDTVITDSVYTWPINQTTYTKSGIYREVFSSHAACDSIRTLVLIIKKTRGIYYPNVIRPGGPNGWFTIFDNGSTIEQINSLSIYDRWGDLIWQKHGFAANTTALGWDGSSKGKSVLPGVYVWHAQLALRDGSITTEKGDVTVLR
ncbi:MAG: gliding motility-associated C-terminal domain-containing protein [Saprospiraceae bacterium]|nr:gliding motility-associated C-terminal domain-containing protein [Saprospiraceae bacterium]